MVGKAACSQRSWPAPPHQLSRQVSQEDKGPPFHSCRAPSFPGPRRWERGAALLAWGRGAALRTERSVLGTACFKQIVSAEGEGNPNQTLEAASGSVRTNLLHRMRAPQI